MRRINSRWARTAELVALRLATCLILLLSVLNGTTRKLVSQDMGESAIGTPTGFHIEGAASLGRPFLPGGSDEFISPIGDFAAGAGGLLGVGFNWRSVGFTGNVDVSGTSLNGRNGLAVGLSITLDWTPTVESLGSWQPRASIGYVRQAIAVDEVSAADGASRHDVGVMGNGVRVGIAVEHSIATNTDLTVGVIGDLMSYGTGSLDGGDFNIAHPSISVYPRLAVGVRFWPFTR